MFHFLQNKLMRKNEKCSNFSRNCHLFAFFSQKSFFPLKTLLPDLCNFFSVVNFRHVYHVVVNISSAKKGFYLSELELAYGEK